MEDLGVGFVILHQDGSLRFVNPIVAEIVRLPVWDVEGRQASCFMDSHNDAAFREQLALRRQGSGAPYDLRLLSVRHDSTRVRIFPSPLVHEGRFLGSCGLVVAHDRSSTGPSCRIPDSLQSAAESMLVHGVPLGAPDVRRVRPRLSPNEQEIFERLAPGESVEDVARALGLSTATVRDRLQAIYDKYGVQNRFELWGLVHVLGRRQG